MKKLYIIGAGGYAKSVLDSLSQYLYDFQGFIDDYKNGSHLGYPILGKNLDIIDDATDCRFFIAIGDNKKRAYWYNQLKEHEFKLINVIDSSAIVSNSAKLGEGCFIGKMAIVNAMVTIGNNCIINTKALVEHGVTLDNHINISTSTVINGDVHIQNGSFIGSSSVVNGQLTIGKETMVGSGAVVISDVKDYQTVVGVPARVIKERKNG
ncbi:shikimate dehydrogenase [Aerococcus urinaehominis]|uniref:Shikimate dehydrogenase n=1 Tax=Aerococcus urinaehominis TaxID=128944 RepID=A0A0X8FMM8_9LACT|nr:acetyltransferase [Aerococcus urinaehominis]AMB99874.1 shikimate dehydrogenase [Aerococcus urinaehominis]SDM54556.1 sugar O-acyltransferase, sialic acid O-acetyltransferase NeuD family [Aerococcus urinaehominis]